MAADAPKPWEMRTVPIQPMALPDAIYPGAHPAGPTLQWTGLPNERIVRNVKAPSLYAVKPAAGKGNGRAVLVVPGGGYKFVAVENEGMPVAQRLADAGYTAFVLLYRVNPTPVRDEDFAAAINREIAERFSKPVKGDDDLAPFAPAVEDARMAMRWLASTRPTTASTRPISATWVSRPAHAAAARLPNTRTSRKCRPTSR